MVPAALLSATTDSFELRTMSATPAQSNTPDASSPPAHEPQEVASTSQPQDDPAANVDQLVLDYLRQRGHGGAERALRDALGLPSPPAEVDDSSTPETQPITVSDAELRKHLVPFWKKRDKSGENALADAKVSMQGLVTGGVTTSSVAKLIENINPGGADEILSLDPTDKHEGFRDLEAWVEGSLDMYRVSTLDVCAEIFK